MVPLVASTMILYQVFCARDKITQKQKLHVRHPLPAIPIPCKRTISCSSLERYLKRAPRSGTLGVQNETLFVQSRIEILVKFFVCRVLIAIIRRWRIFVAVSQDWYGNVTFSATTCPLLSFKTHACSALSQLSVTVEKRTLWFLRSLLQNLQITDHPTGPYLSQHKLSK